MSWNSDHKRTITISIRYIIIIRIVLIVKYLIKILRFLRFIITKAFTDKTV